MRNSWKVVIVLCGSIMLLASTLSCGGGGDQNSPNVLGGYVYFPAYDGGSDGYELWRSNGVDAPSQVADINSGADDSYPYWITESGGKLYFIATTPTTDWELFVYDPVNGASLAADINTFGSSGSDPDDLA